MLNTTEAFADAQKANLELFRSLSARAFEGAEQLAALNLRTARASFDDVAEAGLAALSASDAQTLWAVPSGLLKPAAEKASTYGRQVIDILAAAQAEFDKVAAAQSAAAQKSLKSALEATQANLQALAAPQAPKGSGD